MFLSMTITAVLVLLVLIKLEMEEKPQGRLINGHFWLWSDSGFVVWNNDGLKHTLKYTNGDRLLLCGTSIIYSSIGAYLRSQGDLVVGVSYIHKFSKQEQTACIKAMKQAQQPVVSEV